MAGASRTVLAAAIVLGALAWPCIHLLKGDAYLLDLDVYLHGGHAALTGHDVYAVRVQGFGFTYPPFAALLLALPSLMSLSVAGVPMTLLSIGALAVIVRLSDPARTDALWRDRSLAAAVVIAVMIAMQPVRTTLWLGQVDLLLTAMIMYDLLGARPRRGRGALVGIAAAIKLTPAIFVLYLLLRRRNREAVNAVAAFLAATALAAAVLPHDSWHYWTSTLWHGDGLGSVVRDANKSLLGVADRLFGDAGGPVFAVLAVPIALAGLWIAARVSDTGREPYALGLVGVTGCLVSPASWSHHWVWLIPGLAGAATAAGARGRPTRIAVAVGALWFVAATQFTSPAARRHEIVHLLDAYLYFVAGIALLAFAAFEGRAASEPVTSLEPCPPTSSPAPRPGASRSAPSSSTGPDRPT